MRILILKAHPRPSASIAQRALSRAVVNLANITYHDLYAAYPDFSIDAAREQALLLEHDLIVMQHPFYWYSSPAILKEWQDIVLESGWAYGPGGNRLHGKFLMSAISTGGAADFYREGGRNRFTIESLLAPFNQTAHLCGMAYLKPFIAYEGRRLAEQDMQAEVQRYTKLLTGLADGSINPHHHVATGYPLPAAFQKARAP